MKLVVAGGNGFIGSHVCRLAVNNGHDVVAFGRSGKPDRTPVKDPWVGKVDWRAADVFDVDAWRDVLDGADAFVHTIGTITQDPAKDVTFDRINGESALVAAEAVDRSGVDAFVFLSVRDKPPFVSGRFLASKRRPEREIPEQYPALRFTTLRPNLVYGGERTGTATMAAVMEALEGSLGAFSRPAGRPLPVELVAATAVHAAVTPTVSGVLSVDAIDDLGRTSGLLDPVTDVTYPSLTPLWAGLGGAVVGGWLLRKVLRSDR